MLVNESVCIISTRRSFLDFVSTPENGNWLRLGNDAISSSFEFFDAIIYKFNESGPTLICIDAELGANDHRRLTTLAKMDISESMAALSDSAMTPESLSVLKMSNLLRLKHNWRKCRILFFADEVFSGLSNLISLYGSDMLIPSRRPKHDDLEMAINSERAIEAEYRTRFEQNKTLKVLVAENNIDICLLLKTLLADFCDITVAVENEYGSLKSCRRLSASRVLEKVRSDLFDAIVVDLALSLDEEIEAEDSSVSMIDEVKIHLEGLAAISSIRKEYNSLPICVLSNYVFQPGFLEVMKKALGPDTFDSTAIFAKDPNGRNDMCKWLQQLLN